MPPKVDADLTMPHLRQARDEVHQAFDTARVIESDAPIADAPAPPDPRRQREFTFSFSCTDSLGNVYKGTFTNRILTIGDQIKIGVVRGRRQAGVPLDSMPPRTVELLYILGWMEESLIKKPAWAENLFDLVDEDVAESLWEEVARHERTFRGREKPNRTSQSQPASGADVPATVVEQQVQAAG